MENYKGFLNNYINSLVTGNRKDCQGLILDYLKENPNFINLYENLIKESLYEIGLLWETHKISVASEHLATSITETILNRVYEKITPVNTTSKVMIGSCVENEEHQIGIKMVTDLFEYYGWKTYFLGANLPLNDLISFIDLRQPQLLALSLSLSFNLPILERMIDQIKLNFPELTILIGGQAFRHQGKEIANKYNHVYLFTDLYSVEAYLKEL